MLALRDLSRAISLRNTDHVPKEYTGLEFGKDIGWNMERKVFHINASLIQKMKSPIPESTFLLTVV